MFGSQHTENVIMQVQISTDNHVAGGEELPREVEAVVEGALGRFSD